MSYSAAMRTHRSAWLVVAAVAAVTAVVEAPILLGGHTWADRAYQTEVLPARAAAGDAWAAGRLPEWWDGTGLGVPLAAEPSHGAMDPLLAAVGAAPDAAPALDLMIALHVLLGAIGVAMWARRRAGESDLAAVVAAVAGAAIAASGAMHAALLAGGLGVAWLPWVGWAAEPPPPDGVGALGIGVRRARMRRAVAIAALIGAVGLEGPPAAAIDAVIIALAVAIGDAHAARDRFAWPLWIAGACATGALACAAAWLPAIVHRAGDVAATGAVAPTGVALLGWLAPSGTPAWHLGALWPALAAIAVAGAPRGRRRGPIALAAAALAMLGLAYAIDLAATAADPVVHVAAASMVLCVLGAAGLDRLSIGLDARAAVALGAAAVVIAAGLASRHEGAVASIGELGAIAMIALAWPRGGGVQLAAALLAVGPGFYVLRDAAPLVSRDALADRPVLAPRAGVRVWRGQAMDPDSPDPARRAIDDHATIAGDVVARFGSATAQTHDPGRSALEDGMWRASSTAGRKMFDRFTIDTAILPSTVAHIMKETPLAERGRWALIDVLPRRPRAFVAQSARGAATPADEVHTTFPVTDAHETPLGTVVIAGGADHGDVFAPPPIAPCDARTLAPERVVVGCAKAPAGWAVINDAWAPGWTATVDGADAPVARADALVRAVPVGAGDHEIVWTYRAPWLRAALIATGLAWVHLALGAWLARRRRV
jgi:hypothetical protein